MSEGASYDRSNMSPADRKPTAQQEQPGGPISRNVTDAMEYPSLSIQGLVNVELPVRPGREPFGVERRGTERMLAQQIPNHIATQVEGGFRVSPGEAIETLHWYLGCVKGSELLDSKSTAQLESYAVSFLTASKPKEFFINEVQPS